MKNDKVPSSSASENFQLKSENLFVPAPGMEVANKFAIIHNLLGIYPERVQAQKKRELFIVTWYLLTLLHRPPPSVVARWFYSRQSRPPRFASNDFQSFESSPSRKKRNFSPPATNCAKCCYKQHLRKKVPNLKNHTTLIRGSPPRCLVVLIPAVYIYLGAKRATLLNLLEMLLF